MKKYNVAVVGATGLVGQTFLKVLKERNFPVEKLYLYASARSAGKIVNFDGKDYTVIELKEENKATSISSFIFSKTPGGNIALSCINTNFNLFLASSFEVSFLKKLKNPIIIPF